MFDSKNKIYDITKKLYYYRFNYYNIISRIIYIYNEDTFFYILYQTS